jgi:LacI family transcriptional regulator
VVVGYDLMDVTRAALLDGTMTLVISHPLNRLAREAIDGMIRACASPGTNQTSIVPFDIFTRENI